MKKKILENLLIKNQNSIYLYSVLIGLISGLATMIFVFMLDKCVDFIHSLHKHSYNDYTTIVNKIKYLDDNILHSLLIVFLPAIGGLLAGLIIQPFSKNEAGTGANELINAFHNKEGRLDARLPIFKAFATIATISSGGSGGKEGPIAQVGASIGAWVANITRSGARARRTLLLAGTAAGLGAVFKAPLGGAFTASEMVYKKDIESDALIPCFIASVTAYLVYTFFIGKEAFVNVGEINFLHMYELIFYIILGALCFLFGYLFIKGFKDAKSVIGKMKIHPALKPAVGGFLVGCMALLFFEVLGTGSVFLQRTFDNLRPNYFGESMIMVVVSYLLIAFLKIVATTLTMSSGGSGGIFGPSLFIGGMLGAAVGTTAQYFLPEANISIGSYIIVGMGAFYAGIASAPIAGIIMVFEMTGSYILLPPLIIVSIFTFVLSNKITYYKSQVENRFKSPAHHWDMKFDVINTIRILDRFKTFNTDAIINKNISLNDLHYLSLKIKASDFIVTDNEQNYSGILSLRKVDLLKDDRTKEHSVGNYIENIEAIQINDTLGTALKVITANDVDKVCVLKENRVVGYITTKDIFNAYSEIVNPKK